MNFNPIVSVIVPIYNAERFIKKCVSSLLCQSYGNLEIILIDDGSTDDSLKLCKELKLTDSRIKVYNKKNGGPSSTRNMGIEMAIGQYILFIDSDDYIDFDAIEKMLFLLCNGNSDMMVGIKHKIVALDGSTYIKRYENAYNQENFIRDILLNNINGSVCGYLFSRKLIGDLRFDESTYYMEDTIFLFKYLNNISNIEFLCDTYYYYIFNSESTTNVSGRIVENINKFMYSMDIISDICKLRYSKYNFDELVLFKKGKLLKNELEKISSKEMFYKISNEDSLKVVLRNTLNNKSILDRFFVHVFMKKKYFLFKFYLNIKTLLKCVRKFLK